MQRARRIKPTISLRLHVELLKAVDELTRRTGLRSRTEFIERAIERYVAELKESKIVVVRSWTVREARVAVLKYLRKRPAAYVSDLIEGLGMEPDLAFRTVDALLKEGSVDRTA